MVPLRIVVLASHSIPGIEEVLRDPNRGVVYELAAVIRNAIVDEQQIIDSKADYLVLAGYRHPIPPRLFELFPMRILKLHDGVFEALYDGANETRSSMSFLTDGGRESLFLLGAPYPVAAIARDARAWGDASLLNDYAELHRRWTIRATWGPMFARAMEFLAAGTVQIIHDVAWIDGAPGPCRLGTAPALCHAVEETIVPGIPTTCPLIRG
jgi:hypothetical protein